MKILSIILTSFWEWIKFISTSTGLDTWNVLVVASFIISFISLWFTWKTVKSIKDEADRNRIDKSCQYLLLVDIVRHLYRNKVCTLAMQIKIQKQPNSYPSEEHFLKLQLLPKDLYLEQFYKDPDNFDRLHNLELLLRNYNTEIEVAMKHISALNLPIVTKMRDMATLRFKPDYLVEKILDVMNVIWPDAGTFSDNSNKFDTENAKKLAEIITNAQHNNIKDNSDSSRWGKIDDDFVKNEAGNVFGKLPFNEEYLQLFVQDVRIECGTNKKDEEKIHMVSF